MRRREPPPLAKWMLEHLTSGDRDEALAGDLLEVFRTGRSNGWYRRQALAACVVSWFESLRPRIPLLVFVFLWSTLAPAWQLICDKLESAPIFNQSWTNLGPLWLLFVASGWLVLHSIFLWGGILVFTVLHPKTGSWIRPEKVKRSFLLAPLVFVPTYGTTFVLANLYWWAIFANTTLATTPLGRVADWGLLADVMRIPYSIALLIALWRAIPHSRRASEASLLESSATEALLQSGTDPFVARRFFTLMVGAGLMNALILGFLVCRLPDSHTPTLISLCIRSLIYVLAGALAGAGGTYLYWKNPASPFRAAAPMPFPLFALICAAGWVWVPSIVIFSQQLSPVAAFVAMIGSFVLVSSIRGATDSVFAPPQNRLSTPGQRDFELFAESLYQPPVEMYGYAIAIGLFAAAAALIARWNFTGAALLVLSASLLAWHRTLLRTEETKRAYRRASLRVVALLIPAVLVTAWALLQGVGHRNRLAAENAALAAGNQSSASADASGKSSSQSSTLGAGGYESVILWPYPEKKQIIPPIEVENPTLAPGSARPLVIRFDGVYWFVQPPEKSPGPEAHQSHGTPLGVDVSSSNTLPLTMAAHQNLSASIFTARCREFDVEIENRDNRAGAVSLAVLLGDARSANKKALYLGQLPILSTQPGQFSVKTAPVFETLRFPVPQDSPIRKFNEITVVVLPDIEHQYVAPKIAIQQFRLYSR